MSYQILRFVSALICYLKFICKWAISFSLTRSYAVIYTVSLFSSLHLYGVLLIPTRIISHPINSNLVHFQSKSIPTGLIPIWNNSNQMNSHPENFQPKSIPIGNSNPYYFPSDQLQPGSFPIQINSDPNQFQFAQFQSFKF